MSVLSLIPAVLLLLAQAPTPEQKAVGYVLDAVPRWPTENHCFSCHNNGDGARALFVAYRMKYAVSADALKSTLEWLQKPNEWGKSGTLGFGDEKLATIQFGGALVDAMDAGIVVDKSLMARAAAQLLPHQEADGSWQVDAQASAPSAVTYGPVLATLMARRTLERAADNQLADAIARSDGWLRAADIASAVNAAAVVLAFENRMDVASKARVDAALSTLLSMQNSDGGWGAFARTPSEPFESAMALLAMNTVRERTGIEARIVKAREFLISVQSEDGGWPAARQSTTGETYARHISTTAWATQALLATKR
jgi:squalene cyclase